MSERESDCILVEDDNINYKSISCENIPELFLDKLIAKNHFCRFGRINKFILRPKRLSCTVDFEREDEAKNALMNAGLFNGIQFDIKYTELEDVQVRNTEEWIDSDVQAELNAMSTIPPRNFTPKMLPPSSASVGQKMIQTTNNNNNNSSNSNSGNFGLKVSQPKYPKPILKSKLQTNNENINVPLQQRIDTTVKNELESILRRTAITAEEQYKVLDARDKLIRLTTVRTTDITKVVSTQGTCPDMCPEKERLLRETRNQVAVFELNNQNNLTMDHKLAIKEYSRSSADQETPLAHDLRPERVLKMTMNYLMQKIMDLCDDSDANVGDWYHFVWDRTRSIRKDITQQELCSLGGVQLLEQCARFHIHCAARLIAEDPSVFDTRINTENLTKCLQTLKYMYHDLRLKNIKSPKEAEFRGYIVLLNLHDSNFLWEIKQLPNEMQKSNEIQSAVAFYLAMESNNYVKFFRLIKSTTYMNACILLRYFSQVRYKALKTIVKAYNWPRQSVSLTLKYLREILAFESEESTISFFNHYGLECDTEKVVLDRTSLYLPDEQFLMDRALEVVEMKRNVSVGEAICGEPLESISLFEKHEPHCSFDEYGYLLPEAWTAEDQLIQQDGKVKVKTPTRNFDSNIFKVPGASPPISPKQQLMKSSLFVQPQATQSQLGSFFKGGTLFQQTNKPSLFKSTITAPTIPNNPSASVFNKSSIFKSKSIDQNDSIFQKPAENITPFGFGNLTQSPISKSIFAIPDSQNLVGQPTSNQFNNNIFATATAPLNSDNVFQTQLPAVKPLNDNIFQNFSESPTTSFFTASKSSEISKPIFGLSLPQSVDNQPSFFVNSDRANQERQLQEEKTHIFQMEQAKILENERIQNIKESELRAEQEAAKILAEKCKRDAEIRKQQEEAERILNEKRKLINEKSEEILNELCRETENETIKQIVTFELKKYSIIIKNSENLTEEILDEVLREKIEKICNEEWTIFERNQKILEKYFIIWKFGAAKKSQRRKLIQETPIWMAGMKLDKMIPQISHSAQNQSLEMMKRYRLGVSKKFDLFNNQTIEKKLNIFSLIEKELENFDCKKNSCGLLKQKKYFKFILSLPTDNEETPGFNSYYSRFLEKTIEQSKNNRPTKGIVCDSQNNISLCLRKISGILPINEENIKVTNECDHATSLIFLMTSENNFGSSRKRLHHLLKLSQINTKIPVVLIIYCSSNGNSFTNSSIEYALEIENLFDNDKILCLRLIKTDENHLTESLEQALKFLVRNSIETDIYCDLEMQNLLTFLQFSLVDGIWQRFHSTWIGNSSFRQYCKQPKNIIHLYNEAVDYLINLIDEEYQEYPEFPDELKEFVPKINVDIPQNLEYFPSNWKNYENRNLKIKNFFKKIKLKTIVSNFPNDIEQLEKAILDYSISCIPNCEQSYRLATYSAIKILLESLNKAELLELSVMERMNQISWLEIIRAITIELIKYQWKMESKNLPNEIIYQKKKFENFTKIPWWLDDKRFEKIKFASNSNENSLIEDDLNLNCDDIEPILAKGFKLIEKADRNIDRFHSYTEINRDVTKDLDISLYEYEHKKNLKKFHPRQDDDFKKPPEPINKKSKFNTKQQTNQDRDDDNDIDDVIAKAFDVIRKVEKRIDVRKKCEQQF